jgi:hypothetical protein
MSLPKPRQFWLAVVALAVLSVIAAEMFLIWITQRAVNPVTESQLLGVDPSDKVLRRGGADGRETFVVKRRVCASRSQDVTARRQWQESVPDGQRRMAVAWDSELFPVRKGCAVYETVHPVPRTLNPGDYSLQVSIESCGLLGRCREWFLEPVPLTLAGPAGGGAIPHAK